MEEGKMSFRTKLLLGGIGGSFALVIIFIVVIIATLMVLGIIDVEGLSSSSSGGLSYSSNTYLKNIYNECESVIVGNEALSLEDYITGVVSAEAYNSEGMEALKAQAIAARTYVIVRTNNCQNPIRNSSADQNYTSEYKETAIQAVEETAGLVLTYNDQLFLSEYDSYFTSGDDFTNDGSSYSVTYTKQPNGEKHKVTLHSRFKMAAGGHGRGMSQVASYEMAENGSNFEEILNYFYSPGIQIMSLTGVNEQTEGLSADASGFTRRTEAPNQNDSHDITYFYSNNNVSYRTGYVGQCTWYAHGRANEILAQSGSDLNWSIATHAKTWLDMNIAKESEAFAYSTNVNEPKPGAIIVWGSNEFGHVAVVEAVNNDGTIDYSEANISSARSANNPYGFRYQSHISYKGTGVGTISNIWSGYNFIGYIYMIK